MIELHLKIERQGLEDVRVIFEDTAWDVLSRDEPLEGVEVEIGVGNVTFGELYMLTMGVVAPEVFEVAIGEHPGSLRSHVRADQPVNVDPKVVWFLDGITKNDDGTFSVVWLSWRPSGPRKYVQDL